MIGSRIASAGLTSDERTDLSKIARADAGGLDATAESLAYVTKETETHLHSWERWLEKAGTPVAETHITVGIGNADGAGPFIADAGNDDWGAWVQFLGSEDLPFIAGMVKLDGHRILVSNTERNATYFLQVAFGASGAAALAAGTYSEAVFQPAANQVDAGPLTIQMKRISNGTKGWVRTMCPGQNTATISMYFGGHEYPG